MASLLLSRYADMLIMHSVEGWALLPQMIWRFNIYTDPRKPVSVDAGVKTFGSPGRMSPVMITSNYALTYFMVENDIKSANIDCYLVVADTGGNSVESAVAGRYLTAESISNALKENKVAALVDHKHLVIPGLAARLSGEIEELSGWDIIVGPRDSPGLNDYLKPHGPPEDIHT
jgi:acetyl-CoA decarbonylase/synthase complex subunit gamma